MTTVSKRQNEPSEILIVEDNPWFLHLLEEILQDAGYLVRTASSGKHAFLSLEAARPHLVLLDVRLPDINGFELCRRIKSTEEGRKIPVIFISALTETTVKVHGFKTGGVDYITKPFETEEVLARVRTHLLLGELTNTMERKIELKTKEISEINRQLRAEIHKQRRSEEQLNVLRNYLTGIIDSMPSLLIGVDKEHRVTLWNKTAEHVTGIPADEALGKHITAVYSTSVPLVDGIAESIQSRKIIHERITPSPVDEGRRFEEVTIYPLHSGLMAGAVIRIDDITERVHMEEMMVQSQKMLSVGGLAAGMAHEINTPLACIIQTAAVIAKRLSKDSSLSANHKSAEAAGTTMESVDAFMQKRGIPRMLDALNDSARRVAEIIDNMLGFARKNHTKSPHTLNQLMDRTLELAATDIDLKKLYEFKRIEIVKDYREDLPEIPCEGGKIQQVLLNILRNGTQAMHEARIKDPRFILRTSLDYSRKMACIAIEDNGPGMDETVRRRVFEPFFTTKSAAKGTGLGMSVSFFIVTQNHGGEIDVKSKPGAGTTFTIRLPLEEGVQ